MGFSPRDFARRRPCIHRVGVGRIWLAAFAPVFFGAAVAHAADPPLSHNDPSRVAPSPPAATSAPLAYTPAPAVSRPEDIAPRLVLRGVQLDGARAVRASRLMSAWAGFLGKSVSLSDMRAIGHNVEAIYAKAGFPFIAVLLKVQEVQNGVVHYDVVEGRISDLTIIGSNPVARRQATAMLTPLVNRAPLSLGDVESAYELGRKVPGLSISGALRRGDQPGGLDLVVDAKRESWTTFVNVNNLYANAVGPWGVLFGADYFGPSEYGDTTSLQVYTSVPFDRQVLVRASHSRGLNSHGLTATVSVLWGHANPQGDFTNLELATDIEALRLEARQPLWERPNANLVATVALDASDQRTRVFRTVGLSDDKLRTFSAGLAGELTGVLGRLDATAEVRKGVAFAGASRQGDATLSRVGGDPEAMVFRGGLQGETAPIAGVLRLDVRIDAQQADHALTSPDQYSIGNLAIGRGFEPGAALGDSALGGSLEARVGPFALGHGVTAQPFAFVDRVRLWNHTAAPFSQRSLSSVGGGVRLQIAGKVNIEIIYAAPRQPPLGLGERRPSPGVLFNMTIGLNDAFTAIHRRLTSGVHK